MMNKFNPSIKLSFFKLAILVSLVMFGVNGMIAQTIPGSNVGTNCANCTPSGYFVISHTPDISSRTTASTNGTTGGGTAWDNSPLPSPPNGHWNFITLRDVNVGVGEALYTTMDNLTIGTTYYLTFYALTALNSSYSPLYLNTFWYEVSNHPRQYVTMTVQEEWQEVTMSFTATATLHYLSFGVLSTAANVSQFNSVNISVSANSLVACNAGTESPNFN